MDRYNRGRYSGGVPPGRDMSGDHCYGKLHDHSPFALRIFVSKPAQIGGGGARRVSTSACGRLFFSLRCVLTRTALCCRLWCDECAQTRGCGWRSWTWGVPSPGIW